MKCIICQGEDIQLTTVNEELKIGNDIVYVSIKIPVCHTCGEKYYDRRTMKFLDELNQKFRLETPKNLPEVGKILLYG